MLFYAALLLTSLLVTLMLLWLYRLTVLVGRKIFRSSARADADIVNRSMGRDLKAASSAWGRKYHETPGNLARTHPVTPGQATPWGWPGSDEGHDFHPKPASAHKADLSSYLSRHDSEPNHSPDWKRDIGKPVRDDRPTFSSKPQGLKRKAEHKKPDDEGDDKPWGW